MKVSNLNNLKPAKLQPVWEVKNGQKTKLYRCLAGPNAGQMIADPSEYYKKDTLEIDDENA